MTKGFYAGGTFGSPFGPGFGVYIDSHGRAYPQLYGGTPRWGFSAGYTPDLEGLLTGPSISANIGTGPISGNAGMSGDAFGLGFGTPGIGVTHGYGPLEMSQDFSRPWRVPYIHDSVKSAGVPSRYNVWEYDYPEPATNPLPRASNSASQSVFDTGTAPIVSSSPAPRGLPGLMAEAGAMGPDGTPPAGGLLGLIQEYMRNDPDGAPRR